MPHYAVELFCRHTPYRITQELLTNVIRHSEADRVNITLERKNDALLLRVSDNGKGIKMKELAKMKEANDRAAALLRGRGHAESGAPPLQAATRAPAPAPQQGESLCVLDGHAIAYRMFHGMRTTDMKTSDGTPTYAVHGFCNALLKMRELFPGYRMLVAFDSRAPTFRSEVLPEYKANRPAMPDPMRVQMPRILEACTAFGVPQA